MHKLYANATSFYIRDLKIWVPAVRWGWSWNQFPSDTKGQLYTNGITQYVIF